MHFQIQVMKKPGKISLLIFATPCTSVYATPKVVIISLDGATPRIVDQLNASGQLNPNEGINLLHARGFSAMQNITITPLTEGLFILLQIKRNGGMMTGRVARAALFFLFTFAFFPSATALQ